MSNISNSREPGSVLEDGYQTALKNAGELIAEKRNWFIALGILLIVIGLLAIAFPFATTIAAEIFLGWLFLIGGLFQIVQAFSTQRWSQFLLNILLGILYFLAGAWLAFFPLAGIVTLTIFLVALFIAEGILQIIMAFRMRPMRGWSWMLVSGILALLVGVLIYAQLPSSAVWAIGLLVGINIISTGWAYLLLALYTQPKLSDVP
ncbi:MAG: HdeD family acid-resistance protein [Candidatus Competibacteraceae bacterium]